MIAIGIMHQQSKVVFYLEICFVIFYLGYVRCQITSQYGDQCNTMRNEWPMIRDHILALRNDNNDVPRVKRELLDLRIRINDLENRLAHCACPVQGKPIFKSEIDGMDLGDVLDKSCRFYSTLRSGPIGPENPSSVFPLPEVDLYDRDINNNSLTGGWRDPDDGIKYTGAIAWSTNILIWGMLRYEHAYKLSMTYDYNIGNIKWSLNYLMKMFKTGQMYSQVGGNYNMYATLWDNAERKSIAYSIAASDDLADVSAAFSAAYMLFKKTDKEYANELIEAAKILHVRAWDIKRATTDPIVLFKYPRREYDLSFFDELCWSTVWLYKATGSIEYFSQLAMSIDLLTKRPMRESVQFNCTSKLAGILVVLSELAHIKDVNIHEHHGEIKKYIHAWLHQSEWMTSPLGFKCMPEYGTLPNSVNNGFLMLMAIETRSLDLDLYASLTMQLSYILGYNTSSSVVGVGEDYPKRTRHFILQCPFYAKYIHMNTSSCDINYPGQNAFNAHGALINGPDCQESDSSHKPRRDSSNTVSAVNNAAFQSIVAGILTFSQITDAISMEVFDASFYGYNGTEKLPYRNIVHVV